MRGYLVKRVSVALITLFVVITLNFVIFRVFTPHDPTALILDPRMPEHVKQTLRTSWGLDEPLFPNQFSRYIVNLLTWNYGRQFDITHSLIAPEMAWRLRNTLLLLGLSTVGMILIGIPVGILASARRGGKTDISVIGIGLFTWGVPTFFIQLLFLLVFNSYWSSWFGSPLIPRAGVVSAPPPEDTLAFIADVAWHIIGPIITLMIAGFGSWALYTRNILLDALTEDYVLTARAKGVKERVVLLKHAFRGVLPPIVTLVAMAIPGIVTGAIITETIFSWPGIGSWYINALMNRNHPVAQAVLYNYAVLMIGANLVADVAYGILDPRIRVGTRR